MLAPPSIRSLTTYLLLQIVSAGMLCATLMSYAVNLCRTVILAYLKLTGYMNDVSMSHPGLKSRIHSITMQFTPRAQHPSTPLPHDKQTMTYNTDATLTVDDPLYGTVLIHEPVLVALIRSAAMQRLHGVYQYGVTALINVTPRVTRFEHSVGAMLLVRQVGGSLLEQVAALLHDVAHTALSHVVDVAFPEHSSFHETYKREYVRGTHLPRLLREHGIAWESVMEEADFPLLEQPAPQLCADRVDYGLRDTLAFGLLSLEDARHIARAMVCHPSAEASDRRIVCTDARLAAVLARAYMEADRTKYTDPVNGLYYRYAAEAMRRAVALGHVSRADLWMRDHSFWDRLHESTDTVIQRCLAQVHQPVRVVAAACDDPAAMPFRPIKVRTLDPEVLATDMTVRPLSRVDAAYHDCLIRYHLARTATTHLRVLPY